MRGRLNLSGAGSQGFSAGLALVAGARVAGFRRNLFAAGRAKFLRSKVSKSRSRVFACSHERILSRLSRGLAHVRLSFYQINLTK
jgi:hypothetical protein